MSRAEKRKDLIREAKELLKTLKGLEAEWRAKQDAAVQFALEGNDPLAENFKKHFREMNIALQPYVKYAKCDTWNDVYRVMVNGK